VPDDVRFGQQWQLAQDGAMGAPRAWSLGRGGAVAVAIVDSGIDLDHRDLQPNLWTNVREVAGNGVDDDGDGLVDDVHGWDFANDDADPSDDNGHGTHVAGIVAARGDNGIGIPGIAWRARIMPVKAVDSKAAGSGQAVAEGIRFAVARGARIVLLALSGTEPGAFLEDAVHAASDAGALVVCAAGNGGRDIDVQPAYPASFRYPNVISVAATARDGSLTAMSDYGRASVDIAASGEGILSTAEGGGYERRNGTSMAAATVAGALALMSAAAPDLSASELRAALLGTARGRGSLPIAGGSLDLAAAMRRVRGLT
jgi:subtilisin family serine protease